jgi:hypothetical protein
MKIVIDIPKKTYNEIKERTIVTCGESFAKTLVKYIKNGTPLPEHHGRLIDADALIKFYRLEDATKYGNETAEQQIHSYSSMMMYEIADMIDNAPTIIEGSDSE